MSSESEFLNSTFKVGVCYNENKFNFSCLDCADLWECTLQKAIDFDREYKNPFEKLEIYMDTFRVPLFRKIKSIYTTPLIVKMKQYAYSVKRDIKGAIKFSLKLINKAKGRLYIIYLKFVLLLSSYFYLYNLKRSLPGFLSFGYRSIDSNFKIEINENKRLK